MMPVGDVKERHFGKLPDKPFGVSCAPDRMLNAVGRTKVVKRFCCHRLLCQCIYRRLSAIRKKHWSGLRAEDQHMSGAIILLVTTRALVLTNNVLVILINRTTCDYPNLFVFTHNQTIKIETWRRLHLKWTTFLQLVEVLQRFAINQVAMNVGAFG